MKAAAWNPTGHFDIVDRDPGDPPRGWARVRVAAAGICGSDLNAFHRQPPPATGSIAGHEVSGIVEATGAGVDLTPGTAVAVEPTFACGQCAYCRTGHSNRCQALAFLGGVSAPGGFSQSLLAPAAALFQLPSTLSAGTGALVEPLAVAVHGARLSAIEQGQRVLVLGSGVIGLFSLFCARLRGATEVFATARYPHQAEAALALGADRVFGSSDDASAALAGMPIDCVLETVGGKATTLADAILAVRPGGVVGLLGIFDGAASVPAFELCVREVHIVGSCCYNRTGPRPDFALAIEVLARHRALLEPLITHVFPLEQIEHAFATASDKRSGAIRVHIRP